MKPRTLRLVYVCALTALISSTSLCQLAIAEKTPLPCDGQWSHRTQLVLDGRTDRLNRMRVRVWDPHPCLGLEFYWEPTKGEAWYGDRTVGGWGTLTWRMHGAPRYSRASVYSTYKGHMRNGRPDGVGRLSRRDGLIYEGEWVDGLFHGQGFLTRPDGDQYEGRFRRGRFHGQGRHATAGGEIYEGTFNNGRRHGQGTLTYPDGRRFSATWSHGVAGDASTTQWKPFGDQSERVNLRAISVGVMPVAEQGLSYKVTSEGIAIEPDGRVMALLNGTGVITSYDNAPLGRRAVELKVRVANKNATPVYMSGIFLEVAESVEDRRPMLVIGGPDICSGDQSSGMMTVRNQGWSKLSNVRFRLAFADRDGRQVGPWFERATAQVGASWESFGFGDALTKMGVKTGALSQPFKCKGESAELCLQRAVRTGNLGRLSRIVRAENAEWLYDWIYVPVIGTVSYDWQDAAGKRQPGSTRYKLKMNLQRLYHGPHECGEIAPYDPMPKRRPMSLRLGQRNYELSAGHSGVRRVKKLWQSTFTLSADRTSVHRFRALVTFADGSSKRSPWVKLTYFRANR